MQWAVFQSKMDGVEVPNKNNKHRRALKLAEEILEFDCAISPACRIEELEDVCITLALSIRVNGLSDAPETDRAYSFVDIALALIKAANLSHANKYKYINKMVFDKIINFKNLEEILDGAYEKVKPIQDFEQVELFDEEE